MKTNFNLDVTRKEFQIYKALNRTKAISLHTKIK